MKILLLLISLCFISFNFKADLLEGTSSDVLHVNVTADDDDPYKIQIIIHITDTNGNTLIRPGNPLPLAPDPYFRYFIEFGDGKYLYTTDNVVNHIYKSKTRVKLRVSVDYIYSSGDEPDDSFVDIPDAPEAFSDLETSFLTFSGIDSTPYVSFEFEHSPIVGKSNTGIITYHNLGEKRSGTISFYYNDGGNDVNCFKILNPSRSLWNEGMGSVHGNSEYNDKTSWIFSDLRYGEQRRIFFDFNCDTLLLEPIDSVAFKIEIDFENGDSDDYSNTFYHPILLAHDPNLMAVSNDTIDHRDQELEYKVQFQNDGSDYVNSIFITVQLDDNSNTRWGNCADIFTSHGNINISNEGNNKISFEIDNALLPGLDQLIPGNNIYYYPPSQTIGHITFKIKHMVDPNNENYKMQNVSIVKFGNQEEMQTNFAKTVVYTPDPPTYQFAFRTGINIPFSYKSYSNNGVNIPDWRNLLAGVVLIQNKPAFQNPKLYWQHELTYSSLGYQYKPTVGSPFLVDLFYLEAVPLHLRYKINNHLGIGAGLSLSYLMKAKEANAEQTSNYARWKGGVFADVSYNVTNWRAHTSIGARLYAYYSSKVYSGAGAVLPIGQLYIMQAFW